MAQAIQLARDCEGLSAPNPPVGAVIVRGHRVVGRGAHRKAGTPHAEIHALREAGARAAGATLYVTLEPCSTTGRTGPCVEAIAAAGIRRAVLGSIDPNPDHRGRGVRRLRRSSVEVTTGVLQPETDALLAPFACWVTENRPYLSLKLAMTLDGRIADARGTSRWITGPRSRERVQALRRRADAIMVGAETARRDDPSLSPRPARDRRPRRVIVAGKGPLPTSLKCFRDRHANRTLVAVPAGAAGVWQQQFSKTPVTILPVAADRRGGVRVQSLLRNLAKRDVMHVLCEGGGQLAGSLIRAACVDEYHLVYAPRFLGESGRPSVGQGGWALLRAPRLTVSAVEQLGDDLWVTARP